MAKRHPADDMLSGALAILTGIEVSTAGWAADKVEASGAVADDDVQTQPSGAAEPFTPDERDAAVTITGMENAEVGKSPLVRFVQHLDDEISSIIALASDTKPLSFPEKVLSRLRLRRTPQDMHRRDGVLAVRLVPSLERASRLIAALETHRQVMKARSSRMEEDLIERIGHTKSIDDDAIVPATEQLSVRQDVAEAIIRHEAVCNLLYHKLTIETERGLVALKALNGGHAPALEDRFSQEAREALSSLLSLCEKNMLSMREVNRRKHAVDDSFRHRFGPVTPRRAGDHGPAQTHSQAEQAAA
jgi:hypothetical protein